jgi:hypothetical protein
MANGIYERFKANLMDKIIDLGTGGDAIRVALLDNVHSFLATHNTWSQISANEIAGTGYTANGELLASQTVTQAASAKFDGADTAWTTATFSAWFAVLYDDTLAGDDLICSFDFDGEQAVVAGTFTIQWHADGIITMA